MLTQSGLSLSLCIMVVPALVAQDTRQRGIFVAAESSVAKIMATIPITSVGSDLLRQANRSVPSAKLTALADTLVRIAVAPGDRAEVVYALLSAGRLRQDEGSGSPLPGVQARMIQIYESAPRENSAVRNGALYSMLFLPPHDRALRYVVGVAEGNDKMAYWALNALINDAKPAPNSPPVPAENQAASLAAIRRIWDRRLSDTAYATKLKTWIDGAMYPLNSPLTAFAASQGWPMPPRKPQY